MLPTRRQPVGGGIRNSLQHKVYRFRPKAKGKPSVRCIHCVPLHSKRVRTLFALGAMAVQVGARRRKSSYSRPGSQARKAEMEMPITRLVIDDAGYMKASCIATCRGSESQSAVLRWTRTGRSMSWRRKVLIIVRSASSCGRLEDSLERCQTH